MTFEPRFGSAANDYESFRPDYPPELFAKILDAVPSSRRNRAMDLGAGTGKVTRVLAEHFAEVIAVEPDPLMSAKLREAVPRAIVRNAEAESFVQPPSSVDLITIASALHWMDAGRVIANAESCLRPEGILAVCGGRFPRTPPPIREVIRHEFDERWNQFRDSRLNSVNSSESARAFLETLGACLGSLVVLDDAKIPHTLNLSPAGLAGFCRSTSFGAAYSRSLSDPDSYWRGLEDRFRRAWPGETFPVDFSVWLLLAKKPVAALG